MLKNRLFHSALLLSVWCLSLLAAPSTSVLARQVPDRPATEQRLRALREQIELDQARLSQTAEAEQASLEALQNLDRQIALREELIKNCRHRLLQLSFESDSLRSSMAVLEHDLDKLRGQYRKRAVHGYKYGRLHDLALILAARDVNQMLVRVRYLHRFADQRRRQLADIERAGVELRTRRDELQATREQTEQLLAEAQEEERNLTQLQQERRRLVQQLRAEREMLQKELEQSQAAAQQLEARMRQLVAAESSRRRTTAGSTAPVAYSELSGSFLQNRGRLPWPSEGVVQEPFGHRVNPVYGTTTSNPGVLIATNASAEVRAVFDGEVVLVDVMPDYGTLVTIAHGEYKSVYSNFSLLYVTEGDPVRAGQIIGRAGTDAQPRGRGVFFALFKNGEAIDPLPWLRF